MNNGNSLDGGKQINMDQYQKHPQWQQQMQMPNNMQYNMPNHLSTQQQVLSQLYQTQPQMQMNMSQPQVLWTSEEMQLLVEGLTKFPESSYDEKTRFHNIGKMIETKSIRDISNRVKELQALKKRKSTPPDDSLKKSKKEEIVLEEVYDMNSLLMENNEIIAKIQENLLKQDIDANHELITKFRSNVIEILTTMSKTPGIMSQMPPIPIKLNSIQMTRPQKK